MDDYDIELTPNDPEFCPDECESAYALWAFKEDGEPVKFLEASLVEDPDYVSAAKGLRSNSGLFDAMSRAVGLIRATEGSAAGVSDCALAQSLLITGFHHMQNRCFDTVSRGLGDVRYMDTSKAVKIFAEELTRDTGLALDAALKGKYAMRYGRDVDALIFTDADIDEYAELLGNCCADLDPEQRSKAAADAVREWCRDHAMDGFSDFLYDYQPEQVKGMARNTGVRH